MYKLLHKASIMFITEHENELFFAKNNVSVGSNRVTSEEQAFQW